MSERDDIDVIDNAKSESESSEPSEKISTNENETIRQNPLTHSGDKPAKKGLFEKLRRAFSTENADGETPEEEEREGGLIDDEDGLGGFINIFKRKEKAAEKSNEAAESGASGENTDTAEPEEKINTDNEEPSREEEFDPEEEEEFRMINAILDGEEYEPTPKEAASEEHTEAAEEPAEGTPEEKKASEEKESAEIPPEASEEEEQPKGEPAGDKSALKSESDSKVTEYDVRSAFENEEAEFDIGDPLENEEAEFIMIDIDDDEEADVLEVAEVKVEVEIKSELTEKVIVSENSDKENKNTDITAEKKSEGTISEEAKPEEKSNETVSEEAKSEEKSDETISEEAKSEEKSDETIFEEAKSEEKSDETASEEAKSEEKSDETDSAEVKSEEKSDKTISEEVKSEEKSEEPIPEEVKSEEKSDETASEEVKSEEKSDETISEEAKSEEKSNETISEEVKSEEKSDKTISEEVKSEEKSDETISEEVKSEEKSDETASEEVKSEEKSDETISEEVKSEETTFDDIKVEEINNEGSKPDSEEELDDEDEEFRFDEDYVFDESDDEDFEDIEKLSDIGDEFSELEGLFNTSQTPKARLEESKSEEDKPEADKAEDVSESKPEAEKNEATEKSPEKNSEESAEKSDSNTDTTSETDSDSDVNAEVKSENASELKNEGETSEQKHENPQPESEEKIAEISSALEELSKSDDSDKLAEKAEKKTDENKSKSGLVKFKSIYAKTKSKLIEMWNTKEDGLIEEQSESTTVTEGSEKAAASDEGEPNSEAKTELNSENKEEASENKVESDKESADTLESDSENVQSEVTDESIKTTEFVDISQEESVTVEPEKEHEAKPAKIISMTAVRSERGRETADSVNGETDILTEEQKHQLEVNRKVLEKVKQYEEETAEKREELRKARAERSAKEYEKAFGGEPVTEVEITDYQLETNDDIIKVKAGKFTESVRSEYEFYVGYSRLRSFAKKQTKVDGSPNSAEGDSDSDTESRSAASSNTSANAANSASAEKSSDEDRYAEFEEDKFAKSRDRLDSISKRLDFRDSKNPDIIEYRSEDDAVPIKKHLQENLKKANLQWTVSLALTFVMFVLFCLGGVFTVGKGDNAKESSERVFAFINLIVYGAMLYNCRGIISHGLAPLRKFKSNSDTGVAAAAAVTAVQAIFALITPAPYLNQGLTVYTILVTLALAVNSYGRSKNADRISSNFRFVSDSSQKYTGKFFHDQRMVATLLSGTRNDKSELVFQKKTSFLKHFMKLSHSPDPGDDLADKFSLPAILFALLMSIVYLFLSKSFFDSISVLSVMLCAAVPMCSKALGAVPLHKLAKNSLANQSMVVGYQAVDSFAESAAVMLDAKELYPEGSVHLNGIKKFDTRRIDDAMLAAASVIITAGGAMAGMFDGIIQGNKLENLPPAESVMYEDGKGLIGWVNNERIFVGNRQLLRAHGINPMSVEYEQDQKKDGDEILYLACAGELVAMFIVGYSANRRVADALKRMEANGMSLLIRTTDVNITAERIAKDFGISHRSIKILEQKNSNVIRDEMIGREKSSPAFVATKGGVTSFGRAVSGCIQTKRNISLSLAVQIVGVLLGLLIVTVITLFSGVHHIGAIQLFLFYLFWVAAVLAAPMVVQKIQKY